jgi:hypothetical protein
VIAGLDSSYNTPSPAQADAARAAGVGVWCGYLATQPNVGLAHAWTRDDFEAARRCGGTPLAFCSGHDDPVAVRGLAAAWDVRPCLDVEPGIREDGSWVDGWLAASGAGLYGLLGVHHHAAPFHLVAMYPGYDPDRTWPLTAPAPATARGWQWQGTHAEFGRSVDRLWLDDWFGGNAMIDPAQLDRIEASVSDQWGMHAWGSGPKTNQVTYWKTALDLIVAHLGQDDAALAALGVKLDAVFGGLGELKAVLGTAPPATEREQAILDIVTRMEGAFKQA